MNPLQQIETQCVTLSDARSMLRKKHEAKMKAQRELDAEYDEDLRTLQTKCTELRAAIETMVEQARPEFLKPKQPKTRVFAGITVGFAKQQDTLTVPEEATLVKNIEQMLPANQAKTLLDRTVTVIKSAFKKLDRPTLQKLGCSVTSGTDKAVVRTSDDDIETLVMKSLGGGKEVKS